VTWLRYFSKHCQVWISSFECFQLWSELPSGEHKRRLQTVQKWQVPKVLWLQFLQVSCSSPIRPSKCQTLLQSQCLCEVLLQSWRCAIYENRVAGGCHLQCDIVCYSGKPNFPSNAI
jgi:hypothetical protein